MTALVDRKNEGIRLLLSLYPGAWERRAQESGDTAIYVGGMPDNRDHVTMGGLGWEWSPLYRAWRFAS